MKQVGALQGKQILVVEDDPIIALHIKRVLDASGAAVEGPAYNLEAGLRLAETADIDAAVLDFRLENEDAGPIARRLIERGVPFLFQTSDKRAIPEGLREATVLEKPIMESLLISTLARLVAPGTAVTNAVVEMTPESRGVNEVGRAALQNRIRQQELLADIGVLALQRTPLQTLLQRTAEIATAGLAAEFGKVLQYIPAENRLLLRAGVGWEPGLIGVASVGADLASPSGYALRTGKPVISNHLEREERFRTPDLMAAHGVRRAMNVILQGDGAPFGVLEVDSRSEGEFTEQDIAFLQGAANILGMAIERERYERQLRAALEHQQILVKEINHRVKNSLQLVTSILVLQSNAVDDTKTGALLKDASARVNAIARAHERLYRGTDVARIDLKEYLGDVVRDLNEIDPQCDLHLDAVASLLISTDRAIRIALLTTELVTNAMKHAYPSGSSGEIRITLAQDTPASLKVSVADDGVGLPKDTDLKGHRSLGTQLILALVDQLGGTLQVERRVPGIAFIATMPVEATSIV